MKVSSKKDRETETFGDSQNKSFVKRTSSKASLEGVPPRRGK
jgi:hypothetical protein